ncbi:MAG: DegT/DnrJ/EryC1/StrS family aminotransferase [Candidatus Woesearchaeota archaeon]
MTDQTDVVELLQSLTNKSHITFFNRCDHAIDFLLGYFKTLGALRVFIPDSGGWFSYQKLPLKHGLEIISIKTNDSLIDVTDLNNHLQKNDIVIINAYGGYFVRQPLEEIYALCKEKDAFFINDACAAIGTSDAIIGDFIVCSTRYDKPLAVGFGGFLATTDPVSELTHSPIDLSRMPDYFEKLHAAIVTLPEKRAAFEVLHKKIITDLSSYTILHRDAIGINVTIAYINPEEKEAILNYCKTRNLDAIECPNYIKVMRTALSIEVKRIKFKNSENYKKPYANTED